MATKEYELNLGKTGFWLAIKSTGAKVPGVRTDLPQNKPPSNLDLLMDHKTETTFRITLGATMDSKYWAFDVDQAGNQSYNLPRDAATGKRKRTFCVNTSNSNLLYDEKFGADTFIEFTCDEKFVLDSSTEIDIHLLNKPEAGFSTKIIIDPVIRNQT